MNARSNARPRPQQEERPPVQTVNDRREVALRVVQDGITAQKKTLMGMLGGDEDTFRRFIAVSVWAIQRTPALLDCEPLSLLESVKDSVYYGLEPVGFMGEAAIVPYKADGSSKATATFQPMYRGLAKLARNSGLVAAIDAQIVYEKDEFEVELGSEPRILHRPFLGEARGAYKLVYAYARLTSGELVVEIMNMADVHAIRERSRQWKSSGAASVWGQWPEPMMLKTVLKRLCNRKLPRSVKLAELIEKDTQAEIADQARSRQARNVTPARTGQISELHDALGLSLGDEAAPDGGTGRPDEEASADAHTGGTAGSAAPGASTGPTGDPGPVEEASKAQEKPKIALCGHISPLSRVTCVKPAGHLEDPNDPKKLMHRNGNESWPHSSCLAE